VLLLLLLADLVCQQAPATAQPADETAAAQSIVLDDFERAEPSPWRYSGPGELTIVAGVAPGSEGRSVMRLETTVALRDNRIWFRGSQPCLQAHQPDRDHQPALREPDGGHGLREADRSTPGPAHSPRPHPAGQRRKLPPARSQKPPQEAGVIDHHVSLNTRRLDSRRMAGYTCSQCLTSRPPRTAAARSL